MSQCVQEQIGFIAPIKSERHFFEVGLQMFCTDSVPRSDDTALEQRERGLNRIGVDVPLGVDMELVPNRLVLSFFPKMLCCAPVSLEVIGIQNFNVLAQILANVLFKSAAFDIFGMKESQVAATFADTDDDFLVVETCALPLVPVLSADVGFIHLHFSVEHGSVDFHHCGANAMAEVPSRLVADSECPLNLAGRHPFLGFAEQQRSEKPLCKRQVRIVEHCSCHHTELVVAILAVVERLFGLKLSRRRFAPWALDAFGPTQACKQFPALLIGREQGVYIN